MVPLSLTKIPPSTFISVDLPAPFAPSSAVTSPPLASRCTSLSAWTPTNDLLIDCRERWACIRLLPPAEAIDKDEEDDHRTFDHQAKIVGYSEHIERVADNHDQQRAERGPQRTPGSSINADAPQHAGADRIQDHL